MKRYWLGLAIWGAGLVFVWWLSKGDWRVVSAIATWFLVLGIVYAFLQVQQARRSTNAQIAMGLFKELRDYDTIEKLRSIYDLNPEDVKGLQDNENQEIEKIIDYVLDRLDTLGNLVTKGIIDKELAIETYGGPPALRFWYKLKDYIRVKQDNRGYYSENYENFARLSLDHFKKKGIQLKFYRRGQEDKGIDLVTELQKPELRPRSLDEIKRDRKNRARAVQMEKEEA